jgi:hypothetical protein
MGAAVDNLITRVSIKGVQNVQRSQKLLSAGYRGIAGDVKGASAAFKSLSIDLNATAMAGGMIAGVGAGMLAYLRNSTMGAMKAERVQTQFNTALLASGKITKQQAAELNEYAASISAMNGKSIFSAGEIKNAATMLASFKMSKEEIQAYLPRIMDMAVGLRAAGKEEMSLKDISIMLGKGHAGMITSLRRVGVMVDQNAYKTKGYKAILEELDKEFGGQSAAAADTAEGSIAALDAAQAALNKTMGEGFLPIIKGVNTFLRPVVNGMTELNKSTHGATGIILALTAGIATVGGGILLVLPGIKALRDMWAQVAGAATAATVAQKAASTAGAGAATSAAAGTAANAAGAAAGGAIGWLGKGAGLLGKVAPILGWLTGGLVVGDLVKGAIKGRLGGILGDTGKGAGLGAAAGSIIPGVGALIGGVAGAIGGAVTGMVSDTMDRRKAASAKLANPKVNSDPALSKTNDLLAKLLEATKGKRTIIGGGSRTAAAINNGDVQRALVATLNGVVA